ncbi:MAG TPA: glycosyltransferase family 87 protein [Candidatus Saccharimonadales bacterium]|nr:glycosyltransferase family 87 protein [Candidatus Saccharimonadales bacterium]
MLNKTKIKTFVIALFLFYNLVPLVLYGWYYITFDQMAIRMDLLPQLVGADIVRTGEGHFLYNEATQLGYQLSLMGNHPRTWLLPFRNLPLVAVLFIPLSLFSHHVAYVALMLINCVFLFLTSFVLFRNNFKKVAIYFLFFLAYPPVFVCLIYGQFNCVLLFVVALSYVLLKNKSDGLLLGFLSALLALKINFLLFLPYLFLLSKHKAKFTLGSLLSLSLQFLISLYIVGIGFIFEYPKFVLHTENAKYGTLITHSFSLYPVLAKLFATTDISLLLLLDLVLIILSLLIFHFLRKNDIEIKFSLGIVLTLLLAFHVQIQDLTLLVIPLIVLIDRVPRIANKFILGFVVIALLVFFEFLTSIPDKFAYIGPLGVMLFGLLLLYVARIGKRNDTGDIILVNH